MTTWQSGYVQSGTIALHYQRAGQGVPVILAHGRTDNAACWQAFAELLTAHYDVVMYDARGHGLSGHTAAHYAPHDLAADMRNVIDALQLVRPIVIGHSMGAMATLAAATTYPDQIRAIVLEDPPLEMLNPLVDPDVAAANDAGFYTWLDDMKALSLEQLIVRGADDNPTWQAELQRWQVNGIPHLQLFDSNGKSVGQSVGLRQSSELQSLASSLSAGTPLPQLAGVGAVSSLSNESQPLQETSTAGPRSHA